MSQALRKLTAVVGRSNTCLIFINQIREKIGVMFGSPETTTGGRALKFYSSVRVDIRRITQIKDGENIIGNRTKVKIVKNKVAPPFREAEFDIMYGEGISKFGELIDLGVEQKVVDKSGAWFSYKGERLGQGRENAKNSLRDNKELCSRVENEVRVALGIAKSQAQPAAAAAQKPQAQPAAAATKLPAHPVAAATKPPVQPAAPAPPPAAGRRGAAKAADDE
jgi:recombination protein RecA